MGRPTGATAHPRPAPWLTGTGTLAHRQAERRPSPGAICTESPRHLRDGRGKITTSTTSDTADSSRVLHVKDRRRMARDNLARLREQLRVAGRRPDCRDPAGLAQAASPGRRFGARRTEDPALPHHATPPAQPEDPGQYYSRGFPVCVRAAALRDAMLMAAGYMLSPPSGRRLSGGCLEEPGAVVVPAGGGLVASPPQRPAQGGREPGAGEQPGGGLPGQCGEPGGLGDR